MRPVLLLFSLLLPPAFSSGQLVINEVSQGVNGTKEYAELVVTGTRNCTDSCADLRGWVIDDNNGWLGSGSGQGIALGCMRFAYDNTWACVPYGSIILIYNDGDKNTSISFPDDPSDANQDYIYIVPAGSALFEKNGSTPASPSSPTYTYPTTGFSNGGSWSGLGLSNNGDAIILTSPANLGVPYFSVGFGGLNNSGNATIYKSTAGDAKVYYLTDGQYSNAANWNVGNAPADETPGAPNSASNRQWIEGMRTSGSNINTVIRACILQGGQYIFNGQPLSAAGTYTRTIPIMSGCDSVVMLYLDMITPVKETRELSGCGSISYRGVLYTSSAIIQDTIHSAHGCDSVYATLNIIIDNTLPVAQSDTLRGCGMIRYKGTDYYHSGVIADTLRSTYGCDSIYRSVMMSILEMPDLTVTPDTTICQGDAVLLTATGTPYINWENAGANASVTVSPAHTTTYRVWGQNENGCKDTAAVTITVASFNLSMMASPDRAVAGDRIRIQTSGTAPYQVTRWMPDILFAAQNEKRQEFIGDQSREITVIAISEDGCPDTASISIEVIPDQPALFIPSGFTPNGDGLNDVFMIVGNYPVQQFRILIFDRWGNTVFERHDIRNSWDGVISGRQADIGVYFYMIEATVQILDEVRSVFRKGDVTLIR